MNTEERRAWIMVAVSVVAYGTYLLLVLGGTDGSPVAELAYKEALFWTVIAAIAAGIANVIYLAFVLSSLLSSTAKLFAYRKGFRPW